ncbi:unnamed protein product, partial [Sphacelaria rigidula]
RSYRQTPFAFTSSTADRVPGSGWTLGHWMRMLTRFNSLNATASPDNQRSPTSAGLHTGEKEINIFAIAKKGLGEGEDPSVAPVGTAKIVRTT